MRVLSDFSIDSCSVRPTTSMPEPAGNPSTMVIGLAGQSCANDEAAVSAMMDASATNFSTAVKLPMYRFLQEESALFCASLHYNRADLCESAPLYCESAP